MTRASSMLDRLPSLYREGELVTDLVGVLALQNEILDEEMFEVQRSHWFDTCLSLDEAAALADLLDIAPEPWHSLAEFRPWVHALRDARLKEGSLTVDAVRSFIEQYTHGFQAANAVSLVQSSTPDIIETPTQLRRLAHGPIEPLELVEVPNAGLDPAPIAFQLTGLGRTGPEFAPLLANLTTGAAVAFLGEIPPGHRLIIRPGEGQPTADLEGADVSDKLRIIGDEALQLSLGTNVYRFMPLAHYDAPGLDRFLLDLADEIMEQGRFAETAFDHSLFAQEPAAHLEMAWLETSPATFRAELSAPSMRSDPDDLERAVAVRDELVLALETALARLSAAGVRSSVSLTNHNDVQPMQDRLRLIEPIRVFDAGSVGADRLPEAGGIYDVTDFDDATLR